MPSRQREVWAHSKYSQGDLSTFSPLFRDALVFCVTYTHQLYQMLFRLLGGVRQREGEGEPETEEWRDGPGGLPCRPNTNMRRAASIKLQSDLNLGHNNLTKEKHIYSNTGAAHTEPLGTCPVAVAWHVACMWHVCDGIKYWLHSSQHHRPCYSPIPPPQTTK